MPLTPYQSPILAPLRHGFFTRRGGVPAAAGELDVGFETAADPLATAANRQAIAQWLGQPLVTARQVHGVKVEVVSQLPTGDLRLGEADALVTRLPAVGLGILTADCLPVLLADSQAGVIGAAHAGWRGLAAGILEATLKAMRGLGARNIVAAIGPAIGWESYEVGPDLLRAFGSDATGFVKPSSRAEHFLFNLPGLAAERLRLAGAEAVEVLPLDTYSQPDDFYSHRRYTHQGGVGRAGRQMSAIAIQ